MTGPDLAYHAVAAVVSGGGLALARRGRPMLGVLTAAFALILISVPFGRWIGHWPGDTFAVMRFLAWGGFVWGPVVLLGAVAWGRLPRAGAAAAIALAVGLIGLGVDAFVLAPARLEITTHVVRSAKVTQPLRIAVLADIQTDDVGDREREILALVARQDPDLVLFAGDYVQVYDEAAWRDQAPKFTAAVRDAGLRPRLGAYAVRGNVEARDDWMTVFAGTGVDARDGTTRSDLGELVLTTLSFDDGFDPRLVLPAEDKLHVVLAHGPDFSLGDVHADLAVAGHTHGGQVVIPFFGPPITLTRVPRDWAAGGRHPNPKGGDVVISRGIGMERGNAPRFRIGCPPELVFVEVLPAPDDS